MKQIVFFVFSALLLTACQNEQSQFCEEASQMLCSRCKTCGGDFKQCGLNRAANENECIETFKTICAAYDAKYTREGARLCLQEMQQLTCEQLKNEGKPDRCTALF